MVKCVVSVCPNRMVSSETRALFSRPPKNFFRFPKDPARVKVWLAALRETDRLDPAEQHFICEDHFLPEDLSRDQVSTDAIPIMPPCLDGGLGLDGSWGDDEPWTEEEEEDDDAAGEPDQEAATPPTSEAATPPTSEAATPPTSEAATPPTSEAAAAAAARTSSSPRTRTNPSPPSADRKPKKPVCRHVRPVHETLRRFLELMLASSDQLVDVRALRTGGRISRRIHDVTDVLEDVRLIEKQSEHKFKWIGRSSISNFLWRNQQLFQAEMENLKLVESVLDGLIKSCSQQLFEVTDNLENAALAYVTVGDIGRLQDFQQKTLMVVKAPEETKLEVPAPKEDSIQVHLKAEQGPILVLTCDIGAGAETCSCFLTLEESRIRTSELHTEAQSGAV